MVNLCPRRVWQKAKREEHRAKGGSRNNCGLSSGLPHTPFSLPAQALYFYSGITNGVLKVHAASGFVSSEAKNSTKILNTDDVDKTDSRRLLVLTLSA